MDEKNELEMDKFKKEMNNDREYLRKKVFELIRDFEKKYKVRINKIERFDSDYVGSGMHFEIWY